MVFETEFLDSSVIVILHKNCYYSMVSGRSSINGHPPWPEIRGDFTCKLRKS